MSQEQAILAWMKSGNSITPLDALHLFGCFRLAARIADLKAAGNVIETDLVATPSRKRVARYRLAPQPVHPRSGWELSEA